HQSISSSGVSYSSLGKAGGDSPQSIIQMLSHHKVGPFIPRLKRLILTHIFGKVLGGRLDKAEILPVSAMRVGLSKPFAKSVCKMWVRIRLKKTGAFWPYKYRFIE